MSDPLAEWRIDEADYPSAGLGEERMRFLLGYAILAPSSHNTQPWLFRLKPDGVELHADRTRCLRVVDPHDRALVISCGAALGHLCTAVRFFGHEPILELLPDLSNPDVLAWVSFGSFTTPPEAQVARFHAIRQRRTNRLHFQDERLPADLPTKLIAAAEQEACPLAVITDADRKRAVARLVAEGDRAQFGNPTFRRELGSWVHSRRSASRDGMSGAAFGMPDVLSAVGGLVIRTFDMGDGQAAKDEEVATGSPALLVLATPDDQPENWLRAGVALSSILLDITAAGWTSAYVNQPVEIDELRPRLREVSGVAGYPQLLLRVGRAPLIDPAVRRPFSDTLMRSR